MIKYSWKYPWIKILSPEELFSITFEEITDDEKQLTKQTITQLASELHEATIKKDIARTILIEHILNSRIAYIQSRATWLAGGFAFTGSIIAAILVSWLGFYLSGPGYNKKSTHSYVHYARPYHHINYKKPVGKPITSSKSPHPPVILDIGNAAHDKQKKDDASNN